MVRSDTKETELTRLTGAVQANTYNTRLLVPEVSIDVIERLTDEPGEVVPYTSATGVPSSADFRIKRSALP